MSEGFESQVLSVLTELRGDIAELKSEFGELRSSFGDLQSGFTQQRRVPDLFEGKLDRVAAELATMRPRVTLLESGKAHNNLRSAVLQERMDDHEIRLAMAERRLELRDE